MGATRCANSPTPMEQTDDMLLALHGHLDKTLSVLRSAPAFTSLRGITSGR
jgi:hypothetical protein